MEETRVDNGVFYCKIERDAVTQIGDFTFDLINNPYHLLIATGTSASEEGLNYHGGGNRAASGESFLFQEEISEDIYEGCGKSKWCIGLPYGCVVTKNCVSFGAVIDEDRKYFFEIQTSGNYMRSERFT